MVAQDISLGTTGLIIAAVPCTMIDLIWDKVDHILARPIAKAHRELTIESLYAKLKSGEALLMTVSRGSEVIAAATLEVRTFESGMKALYIPLVGGTDMDSWMLRFLEIAKAIAKDFGCEELRGVAARKGWLRKLQDLGWEEVSVAIKCKVGE